jgi:hypothetical protein
MDIDDEDDFYAPEEPQAPAAQPAAAAAPPATKHDASEELEEGEEEDEGGEMDEDEDSVRTHHEKAEGWCIQLLTAARTSTSSQREKTTRSQPPQRE